MTVSLRRLAVAALEVGVLLLVGVLYLVVLTRGQVLQVLQVLQGLQGLVP